MSARNAIRQFHRWVSMAFTLTVIANFVAMGVGKGAQPPAWITYAPLLPLALLLFTGLYLFALPYLDRRGARRSTGHRGGAHRGHLSVAREALRPDCRAQTVEREPRRLGHQAQRPEHDSSRSKKSGSEGRARGVEGRTPSL